MSRAVLGEWVGSQIHLHSCVMQLDEDEFLTMKAGAPYLDTTK